MGLLNGLLHESQIEIFVRTVVALLDVRFQDGFQLDECCITRFGSAVVKENLSKVNSSGTEPRIWTPNEGTKKIEGRHVVSVGR